MTQPNHQTTTGYNQNKPVEEMTDPAEKLMLVSKVSPRKKNQRKPRNPESPLAGLGLGHLGDSAQIFQLKA